MCTKFSIKPCRKEHSPGLRCLCQQGSGFRVSLRRDSPLNSALYLVAVEPVIHCDHEGIETGDRCGEQEGFWDCCEKR
jgi:hypothetical protein